ncbi:CapA family protein, partial [Enterobacter hormaechei subsp. steigerwaltii]|nr:CapA family protein [Enterobacter hormaechei subsp. steigerwaltii]
MLPIDGSNPAPVSNTDDADGQDAPDEKTADTVSIIGVGDIMLGSNYPVDYLPDTNILKNVESALQDADITVGNLEGTLFDEGGTPKKCATPQNMLCIPNALRIRAI